MPKISHGVCLVCYLLAVKPLISAFCQRVCQFVMLSFPILLIFFEQTQKRMIDQANDQFCDSTLRLSLVLPYMVGSLVDWLVGW